MSTWSGDRVRLAAMAMLVGLLTVVVVVGLAAPGALGLLPWAYVGVVALALFFPAMITVQVIVGQVLVGLLLLGASGVGALLLVPAMAGVVATAELLAAVARLDNPVRVESADDVARVGVAAAIGGGAFVAVALVSGLPGPTGLLAVGLASGACVLVGLRIARSGG